MPASSPTSFCTYTGVFWFITTPYNLGRGSLPYPTYFSGVFWLYASMELLEGYCRNWTLLYQFCFIITSLPLSFVKTKLKITHYLCKIPIFMHSLSAYTSSRLCACDCSDASFGYPGGPLLFKNLNFGIDLDSRIASKDGTSYFLSICDYCIKVGLVTIMKFYCSIK